MKDLISMIAGLVLLLIVLFMIHDSKAGELEITQQLYDQALSEIEHGDRDSGCRKLHEAFAHSMNVDDNWKTYNQIWSVGTLACNWTLRSDIVETSAPKP